MSGAAGLFTAMALANVTAALVFGCVGAWAVITRWPESWPRSLRWLRFVLAPVGFIIGASVALVAFSIGGA
jgi:hypothetical protein